MSRYEKYAPTFRSDVPRSSNFWTWEQCQVHVEHVGDADAAVRIILVHGAGGNGAAMWPFAARLSAIGARVTVPDMPGYGDTYVPEPGAVRYDHWRRMLVDLIRHEDDSRPLIIIGASIGGMLAYDAAALTGLASSVVVTCLLDPRDPAVRHRLTWHPAIARLAAPMMRVLAGPFANVRVPIKWIADMRHIANDQGLVREVLGDRCGGGGRVPLGWMRTFLESVPVVEPEQFHTPILMTHPAEDRWTPLSLSQPFFDRIAGPKSLVMLERCGHFPVEEPGLSAMMNAVAQFVNAPADEVLGHGEVDHPG
ncbi:MAG: hypothetical protein JWQ59_2337 [Cryobacterium sp.]|nr:hypothetical protein [Cryobacterium sp.]